MIKFEEESGEITSEMIEIFKELSVCINDPNKSGTIMIFGTGGTYINI